MPEKDPPPTEPPEEDWEKFQSLEEEVQRIRSESSAPDPAADPEFGERIDALEKRIDAIKARREKQRTSDRKVLGQDPASARQLGIGLTVAYTVLGVPLAFYGVGWLLDQGTGDDQWRTNLTFVGAVLGVTAAVIMLQRLQSRL